MLPKFGIPQHVLWNMDGRTWIEVKVRSEDSPIFQKCLEKGWAKIIPQEKIEEFVQSI